MKEPLMRACGAILVVDTNHAIADVITEILRDDGYAVAIAHDCSEALASITKQRPALVLLDDHVVGLNAACLHAHITHQHQVGIPIITTTTNAAVATVLNRHDSWACLAKPFLLDALVAYITHFIPPAPRATPWSTVSTV